MTRTWDPASGARVVAVHLEGDFVCVALNVGDGPVIGIAEELDRTPMRAAAIAHARKHLGATEGIHFCRASCLLRDVQ